MQENVLEIALAMQESEDAQDAFDEERQEAIVTDLATWCFESFAKANEEAENGLPEDVFIAYVENAIGTAYIAGCLDTAAQETESTNAPQVATVTGKSGTIVNIYVS